MVILFFYHTNFVTSQLLPDPFPIRFFLFVTLTRQGHTLHSFSRSKAFRASSASACCAAHSAFNSTIAMASYVGPESVCWIAGLSRGLMVRARKRTKPLAGRQRELEKMDMKKDRADPPKHFLARTQNYLNIGARRRALTSVDER